MAAKAKATARQGVRRDRNLKEHRHDSYRLFGKLKEPTVCSGCGALFHKGRWTWGAAPKGAATTTCPACHRMHDKYPMGLVTIAGSFKEKQHEQVMGVIHNAAAQEKKEHPLSRIMAVERRPEGLVISTTDTHLPRRIGEALKHAYRGELEYHYDQEEEFIRVNWTR
ncbi:BCAM0308 family protein [Nitrospira sp. NS4]|uniref:BCAM0308 family protein n=1 Tax=Nitrospira sp. NS4 TaxID=3414498 RepID=UPI002CE214B7|nr:BCAM0308 family protein [Nitrospira sp.]